MTGRVRSAWPGVGPLSIRRAWAGDPVGFSSYTSPTGRPGGTGDPMSEHPPAAKRAARLTVQIEARIRAPGRFILYLSRIKAGQRHSVDQDHRELPPVFRVDRRHDLIEP